MMWRGTVFSGVMHGTLFAALLVGIPALPEIFDRRIPPEFDNLPVTLERPGSAEARDDETGPRSAGTENADDAQESSAMSPIAGAGPGGTEPARPAAGRLGLPPSPESSSPEPMPSRSQTRDAVVPAAAPSLVRLASPETTVRRPLEIAVVFEKADGATVPEFPKLAQADRQPSPDAPVRTTPGPEKPPQDINPAAGPPAFRAQPDIPPIASSPAEAARTDPSAQQGSDAEDGQSQALRIRELPFVQAVDGPERSLVEALIASDRRIRDAVLPDIERQEIPERARLLTVARLQKAAESGFAHAEYNLGVMYLRGENVERNPALAERWLSKAAERGYAPAQMLTGLMRFTGVGMERDKGEAAFWWSIAADRLYESATRATRAVEPILKPDEVVRMRRLRARWGSLIRDFADANERQSDVRQVTRELQAAAEQGDIATVLALLARGADADGEGADGRSAVINAAWRGREQVMRILLQRGAATEQSDDGDRTPLLWAAVNGHERVTAELLDSGANPNHRDADGTTPLIRAAWNGHTDVVRMLIAAGADPNLRDKDGLTALARARSEGRPEIANILSAAGAR